MKGIILAGGSGTRLYPITKATSKQLLPVYDKPMIYYPLSVLMLAGITEVLIISTQWHLKKFQDLLGDGSDLNMQFEYIAQESPDGLAQAFTIGEKFLNGQSACLILGDNIFYGQGITQLLSKAINTVEIKNEATVFGYYVKDPERYGVVSFDNNGKVVDIEEKPKQAKSNYAVVGLYFYPNDVVKKAKKVELSERGELEITSINQMYLNENRLNVELMGRGYAWLDTGTHESLTAASLYIQTIEERQSLKVACIEEIAFEKGYITSEELVALAEPLKKNQYGKYLLRRAKEGKYIDEIHKK